MAINEKINEYLNQSCTYEYQKMQWRITEVEVDAYLISKRQRAITKWD